MAKLQLKRSSVLENGQAKAPTAPMMMYGELAVNYNADDPVLFIKDSQGEIIRIIDRGRDGLKGDAGAEGLKGDKGSHGLKGEKGVKGLKGKEGKVGGIGDKGDKGIKGEKGVKGDVTIVGSIIDILGQPINR